MSKKVWTNRQTSPLAWGRMRSLVKDVVAEVGGLGYILLFADRFDSRPIADRSKVMRKEKDALGEVLVPEDKYYGGQTQRARENFPIGAEYFPGEFIRAHVLVKKAAAMVNRDMGLLDKILAEAIIRAADEVPEGKFDDHVLPVEDTGFNHQALAGRCNIWSGATGWGAVDQYIDI
ncbi:lyase family protein [Planctomycetota bacterium]